MCGVGEEGTKPVEAIGPEAAQLLDPLTCGVQPFGLQSTRPCLSRAGLIDQPCFLKHLQMARDSRLANAKGTLEFSDCRSTPRKAPEDCTTRRIGKRGKLCVKLVHITYVIYGVCYMQVRLDLAS